MNARGLRLMAIALGGMALVVVARTGEPAGQDAVTAHDGASTVVAGDGGGASAVPGLAGGLPELAGDQAVRLIDFGEVDQPGAACSAGLAGEAPALIPVEGGASQVLDPGSFARLEVEGAVAYGDLDGDGGEEALVHAVCAFGANGQADTIQVWDLGSGRPEATASLAEPPASIQSRFPPTVGDVTIEDGAVVVTWDSYSAGAPHCCADQHSQVRYQLVNGELLVTGGSTSD
jgi:hypothetical protein